MIVSYLCRLCVKLKIPFLKEEKSVVGYYINIVLDADSEDEAGKICIDTITDGVIDWSSTEILEANRHTVHKAILSKRPIVQEKGLWYKSGRALFPK